MTVHTRTNHSNILQCILEGDICCRMRYQLNNALDLHTIIVIHNTHILINEVVTHLQLLIIGMFHKHHSTILILNSETIHSTVCRARFTHRNVGKHISV